MSPRADEPVVLQLKGQEASALCRVLGNYLYFAKADSVVADIYLKLSGVPPERRFPIQPGASVPWGLAQAAYTTYARLFGSEQSMERLAERGGFGWGEFACLRLGHDVARCRHGNRCLEQALALLLPGNRCLEQALALLLPGGQRGGTP